MTTARLRGPRRRGAGRLLLIALALAAAVPAAGGAAVPDDCLTRAPAPPPAGRAWPAPLDRLVQLRADDASLRTALDRLAAEAGVRLSYSPDLLPLDRPACVAAGRVALGDALRALLAGTAVAPVVAGAEQVVLAPARAAAAADAPPELARTTAQLGRVVVTGTAAGGAERASPFALAVLDGTSPAPGGGRSLAGAFDGQVPGVWVWTQSPTSPIARYGSVRGASSFGVSTPKVYVDGVEMANPLLLTQLDGAGVERVEVIRGPQGAALYGADAISGVVNIVTRHDGVGPGTPAAELHGSAGSSESAFADGGVLAQEHALTLRAGTGARSVGLATALSTLGAFVPGASARQVAVRATARRVGARSVVAATARLHAADADVPASPLLDSVPTFGGGEAGEQRTRQYTLGTTATLHSSERWTHVFVAGVDGYRLAGVAADGMPAPSPVDSALRAARGGADRATLRLSSTVRRGAPAARAVSFTLGAEHSTARERTSGAGARLAPREPGDDSGGHGPRAPDPDSGGPPRERDEADAAWWSNTGLLAQGQLVVRNALYLSGGARAEYVSAPGRSTQLELLPTLGAAWVRERGPLTVKLRAAYGRGIRPARSVARGGTWMGGRGSALSALASEEQSGVEAGADLLWGRRLGLHATRFDQRASGLVQPVAVFVDDSGGSGGPGDSPGHHVAYQLQNVGAIDNRGWELQATSAAGPLALAATLSLVESRVNRLAVGYQGDLRAGDRMLEVPARTVGVRATWSAPRWTTSWSVARAASWVNYDRLALAGAASDSGAPPVGAQLRDYWRHYDGVTHLDADVSFALTRRATLTLAGRNLLNRQLGEPDNLTVVPGRTLTAGVRTGF